MAETMIMAQIPMNLGQATRVLVPTRPNPGDDVQAKLMMRQG
jgi:hypothetical protein